MSLRDKAFNYVAEKTPTHPYEAEAKEACTKLLEEIDELKSDVVQFAKAIGFAVQTRGMDEDDQALFNSITVDITRWRSEDILARVEFSKEMNNFKFQKASSSGPDLSAAYEHYEDLTDALSKILMDQLTIQERQNWMRALQRGGNERPNCWLPYAEPET